MPERTPTPRPAVFITGAAAGIGRATAELFASRGWFVGLYDVADGAIEILRRDVGVDKSIGGRLDVTDSDQFAAALASFWAASGQRLDLMFNCAGILSTGDFDTLPLARHRLIIDINTKGVVNGAYLALPYLKQTPGSRLINMASASAIYGPPGFASYAASKFAVKGLTEALNIEWARYGIRVMDLCPLFVATAMVANVEAQPATFSRLGIRLTAQDIAACVWRAAHRRFWLRVHWYPGWQSLGLAISYKLLPAWLNRLSMKIVSGY